MRNLTSSGEPRFASRVKLCDVPGDWKVNSISIGDLSNDGLKDALVSVHKKRGKNELATELWLLKGE